MRRISLLSTVAVALLAASLMVPASAATKGTIDFTDHRVGFDSSSVTTNLPECPTAVAVDVKAHVEFTRTHGVFIGIRDFQCGGDTGFVVRLTANFADGSLGSWSIVDAYGALEGARLGQDRRHRVRW